MKTTDDPSFGTASAQMYLRIRLASYPLDIELASEVAHLASAFAHGRAPDADTPRLTLQVGVDPPEVMKALDAGNANQHYRRTDEHLWLATKPRQVQLLTLKGGRPAMARLIVEDGTRVDGSIRARPGVESISAWAATNGILPVHASAVALNGHALLLVGESGSGKSTTALALAEHGWQLLGDDRCFVTLEDRLAFVHGLYATAVVTPDALPRLAARNWIDLGPTHHGKHARRIPAAMNQISRARLAGIVWVTPAATAGVRCTVLARSDALVPWQAALAPTLQALGPSAEWLKQLSGFSRAVSAWRLFVDWDFTRIDQILRHVLRSGAPGP